VHFQRLVAVEGSLIQQRNELEAETLGTTGCLEFEALFCTAQIRQNPRTGIVYGTFSGSSNGIRCGLTKRRLCIRCWSRIGTTVRLRRPSVQIHRILPGNNQRRYASSAVPGYGIAQCRWSRLWIRRWNRRSAASVEDSTIGVANYVNRCHL